MTESETLSGAERGTLNTLLQARELYDLADLKHKGSIVTGFGIGYFGYAAYEKKHRTISPVGVRALVTQSLAAADEARQGRLAVGVANEGKRSQPIVEATGEEDRSQHIVEAAKEAAQSQPTVGAANEAMQSPPTAVGDANKTAQSEQTVAAGNEAEQSQPTVGAANEAAQSQPMKEAPETARAADDAERRRGQIESLADMALWEAGLLAAEHDVELSIALRELRDGEIHPSHNTLG
ncbi:hypothetical protein B0A55_11149 [Friedmanniomyces simplex]|uniref:Uncharacterized protein n=1 Tax=Friedmanniomyces simplex TaxID=329884 RepID=A0A4V5NCT7_9PEZI|nr:hypothetical protein B0A55_11149 [Friedmanniomyces simplex]